MKSSGPSLSGTHLATDAVPPSFDSAQALRAHPSLCHRGDLPGAVCRSGSSSAIHKAAWPKAAEALIDNEAELVGEELVAIATSVRRYKTDSQLRLGSELPTLALATSDTDLGKALREAQLDIACVTRAQTVLIQKELPDGFQPLEDSDLPCRPVAVAGRTAGCASPVPQAPDGSGLRAGRQPDQTASWVEGLAKRSSGELPDQCGALSALTESTKRGLTLPVLLEGPAVVSADEGPDGDEATGDGLTLGSQVA